MNDPLYYLKQQPWFFFPTYITRKLPKLANFDRGQTVFWKSMTLKVIQEIRVNHTPVEGSLEAFVFRRRQVSLVERSFQFIWWPRLTTAGVIFTNGSNKNHLGSFHLKIFNMNFVWGFKKRLKLISYTYLRISLFCTGHFIMQTEAF